MISKPDISNSAYIFYSMFDALEDIDNKRESNIKVYGWPCHICMIKLCCTIAFTTVYSRHLTRGAIFPHS